MYAAVYLLRFSDRRLNELVGLAGGFTCACRTSTSIRSTAAEFTSAFEIDGEIAFRVRRTHVNISLPFRQARHPQRVVEYYSARLNAPRTRWTKGKCAANNPVGCHDSAYCSSNRGTLGDADVPADTLMYEPVQTCPGTMYGSR